MNINRIFIIGDSFSDSPLDGLNPSNKHLVGSIFREDGFRIKEKVDWDNIHPHGDVEVRYPDWLAWEYPNSEIILDAIGSRDVQTILDHWLFLIPKLKSNDKLVITIPFYGRQRIPTQSKDGILKRKWSDGEIRTRFISHHHDWFFTEAKNQLSDAEHYKNMTRKDIQDKIGWLESLNCFNEPLEEHYKEVIDTMVHLTPCQCIIWSWDNFKIQSEYVLSKDILTKILGQWKTHKDLYIETNGKVGVKDDFHWEGTTHKLFFEYCKKRFEE